MADDTGTIRTTGPADESKPVPGNNLVPKLEEHELLPQNEIKGTLVSHPAIPVAPIDVLLAPSADEVPPPKVIPLLSVMPHPTPPSAPSAPSATIPVPSTPTPVIIPDVPVLKPEIPLSPPRAPAIPAPAAPQVPFRDNISAILNAIKLPERFTMRGAADPNLAGSGAPSEPVILSETVRLSAKDVSARSVEPPTQAPIPPTAPIGISTEEPEVQSAVTPLRTLKEDLIHVVRDRKISLVRAVALEEDKRRETRVLSPREVAMRRERSRHIFAIVFTAGILFLLGAFALLGVYEVESQRATPATDPNSTSIIFAEQTYSFPLQNLSASDIRRQLAQARNSSRATLGSITRIVPTVPTADGVGARAATTAEFLKALGARASDDLLRALSDQFFFGIHTIDKNAPILVIPVTSYEHAFAGMLAWEPAMNSDFAPAFTALPLMTTDQNGLPTERVFKDVVMRNYDARALENDSRVTELYYSFPVPGVLVIAEDPYSFTEILSRLQVQRRL